MLRHWTRQSFVRRDGYRPQYSISVALEEGLHRSSRLRGQLDSVIVVMDVVEVYSLSFICLLMQDFELKVDQGIRVTASRGCRIISKYC